jgi:hypothetical protein
VTPEPKAVGAVVGTADAAAVVVAVVTAERGCTYFPVCPHAVVVFVTIQGGRGPGQ